MHVLAQRTLRLFFAKQQQNGFQLALE